MAKHVQVHGVDAAGKVTLCRQLRRAELIEFFAEAPRCVVGLEEGLSLSEME